MTMGCARCGACCDPVILHEPLEELIAEAYESGPFIREHWTEVESRDGDHLIRCDAFDPATRLCTAHDKRPPICERFPWYDRGVNAREFATLRACDHGPGDAELHCSYIFDVPPEWRAPGSRPMIPLEVL